MRRSLAVILASLVSCTKPSPPNGPPQATMSAPDAEPRSIPTDAPPEMPAPPATDAGTDAPADAEPPIHVKVVTIGMHVGGGPYDEVTKEPMKRSVEPHFAELARCWRYVVNPRQADVGVDLLIEASGGRARVSNPRTTIEGEGFKPCVIAFFESIEFERPKTGRSMVSYSVRFIP